MTKKLRDTDSNNFEQDKPIFQKCNMQWTNVIGAHFVFVPHEVQLPPKIVDIRNHKTQIVSFSHIATLTTKAF